MKIAIIIFGISLFWQFILRSRTYSWLDQIDGTFDRATWYNRISLILLIGSFIAIIIML